MHHLLNKALVIFVAATLTACAQTEPQTATPAPPPAEKPSSLNVERTDVRSTVATVEAVDLKNRMVTLRSLQGRPFNIKVGEQAVNLPQVKKGDRVEITYTQALEVRMAEPGEVRSDRATMVGGAEPGAKPAGIGVSETNITAEILEIDRAGETATLKMADGVIASVKVKNPENLDKVKVGDTIAIKYIEALEIKVLGKKR